MVQILEKQELEKLIIIIPAKEEKVEKKAEVKQVKKKGLLMRHAKQHEELINIQKLKNKAYGNIFGMKSLIY
ncbi:MAG: hypothetical protein ACFFAQ_06790 [Promethearchaeota archaeon]